MSTKCSYKYVNIKKLTLHLYDDLTKTPALELNTKSMKVKINLTNKELEEIDKQLNHNLNNLYGQLCTIYGKGKIWSLKTDELIDLIEEYLKNNK
jgi:hypothetical protein